MTYKRHKRNKSSSVEPEKEKEKTEKTKIHRPLESMVSSLDFYLNNTGTQAFLVVLMLLAVSSIFAEFVNEYGLKVSIEPLIEFYYQNPLKCPSFMVVISLNVFIINSLLIEKAILKFKIQRFGACVLIIGQITALFAFPILVYNYFNCNPIAAVFAFEFSTVILLKLVSYHCVNYWFRNAEIYNRKVLFELQYLYTVYNVPKNKAKDHLYYPNNLSIQNMYYFIFAPTLCYDFNYAKMRVYLSWRQVSNVIAMFLLGFTCYALVCQVLLPFVFNVLLTDNHISLFNLIEKHFKMMIVCQVLLHSAFFGFFHLFLNLMADLTNFSDRMFYKDWWNAKSMGQFWRRWNIPVHKYCMHHVYLPLIASGCNKPIASFAVFFVSAVFHEYILYPLNLNHYYMATGLLMQVPIVAFDSVMRERRSFNIFCHILSFLLFEQIVCVYFKAYSSVHWTNHSLNTKI